MLYSIHSVIYSVQLLIYGIFFNSLTEIIILNEVFIKSHQHTLINDRAALQNMGWSEILAEDDSSI